jgi:hypothetical protein
MAIMLILNYCLFYGLLCVSETSFMDSCLFIILILLSSNHIVVLYKSKLKEIKQVHFLNK